MTGVRSLNGFASPSEVYRQAEEAFAHTAVIDDLSASMSQLSAYGREVLESPMMRVRLAIENAAAIAGWGIVRHELFVSWAANNSSCPDIWVSLDPLVHSTPRFDIPVRSLRATRVLSGRQLVVQFESDGNDLAFVTGKKVGLIDDSVYSGATLCSAIDRIEAAGGVVVLIRVCTSTAEGHKRVTHGRTVAIERFIQGDHPALHMRDAFPLLPNSGRRIAAFDRLAVGEESKIVAYSPTLFIGSPWLLIGRNSLLSDALSAARLAVVEALAARLGREPYARDLNQLGKLTSIPAIPGRPLDVGTPLRQLIT